MVRLVALVHHLGPGSPRVVGNCLARNLADRLERARSVDLVAVLDSELLRRDLQGCWLVWVEEDLQVLVVDTLDILVDVQASSLDS